MFVMSSNFSCNKEDLIGMGLFHLGGTWKEVIFIYLLLLIMVKKKTPHNMKFTILFVSVQFNNVICIHIIVKHL